MTECSYTLRATSGLTQHALQADILDADRQFEAVHTRAGGTLLFFIGDGDALCVAKEETGREHGWNRADLSSAQIQKDLPWGARCTHFTAVRGAAGVIDLAMVLSDGRDDHLYLSLGNSDANTDWSDDPRWLVCPFNAEFTAPPSTLHIANVLISDASDRYVIVVDIVANPGAAGQMLRRYYLDMSTPHHPTWVPHHGSVGPARAGQISCLGRGGSRDAAEGIYTLGNFTGGRKLLYAPLYAVGDAPCARASELKLPDARAPDAIAACRNADNTTDLYVAARGGLYYFAGGRNHEGDATALLYSPLLMGVRSLRAIVAKGKVVVWGLNAEGQGFYASCPQGQVNHPSAWSRLLCTLSSVTAMSPFFDRVHGALVVLARTSDGLVKAVKSPVTGLWNRKNITLPPSSVRQAPLRMSSYVTCINVTGSDGEPAAHVAVKLSASSVTSVYVNGLYRIVGPVPISVPTDEGGALTIVENADGLAGTRFQASAGGCTVAVNPMSEAFEAAAAMIDERALGTVHSALEVGGYASAGAGWPAPAGFPGALHSDVGDLFSWLDSGAGGTVRIVHDQPTGLWHVVATIGGQAYHGVLDCAEKIVAATLWLLDSVKATAGASVGVLLPVGFTERQGPTFH